MKTRQVKKNHKKYTVNFVSSSQLLAEKVRSFFSHARHFSLVVSEAPLPEDRVDGYVVPFPMLQALFNTSQRPDTWLPVMAYGSPLVLRDAFAHGCGDFLKEPWDMTELEVRLARLMQSAASSSVWGENGPLTLVGNRVTTNESTVLLKPNEARILKVLLKAGGDVVSREVLYYAIWGKMKNSSSRVVDVHVSSLRKKMRGICDLSITQVRGEGYQLT